MKHSDARYPDEIAADIARSQTPPATEELMPVDQRRLVRRWWDIEYPIIARLDEKWDLIAHQNGPAMTDGDTLSSIDTHPDDFRETMMVKMKAQAAWREYSWALLKEGFYPTNAKGLPPATGGHPSAWGLRVGLSLGLCLRAG